MSKFYSYDELTSLIKYSNNKFKNLCNVLKFLSDDNKCNFDDWIPNRYIPKTNRYIPKTKDNLNYIPEQANCSCSHDILHCFTVINKINHNSIIVGSECIKKFFSEEANETKRKLMDEFEGKKKCPSCKKTVSKTVVEKYKHEKNIYHMKCYHGQNDTEDDTEDDIEEVLPPTPPPSYEETLLNNAEDYEKELLGFGKYKQLTIKEASLNNGVRWYYLEKLPYNEINSLKVKKFVDYLKST